VLIPDRKYLLAKLLLLSSAIPMLVCRRFKPVGVKRIKQKFLSRGNPPGKPKLDIKQKLNKKA